MLINLKYKTTVFIFILHFLCILGMLVGSLLCCFQTEECVTVLKNLSSAEAECVVERLTSWARLQLEDKVHISDEVRRVRTVKACV